MIFSLDRASRVLVELSHPELQACIRQPGQFLSRVAGALREYYDIFSGVEPNLRAVMEKQSEDPLMSVSIHGPGYEKSVPNPHSFAARIAGVDLLAVQPGEEDVRPSSRVEKTYFTARTRLLEHLKGVMESIELTVDESAKLDIARAGVEKAIILREKAQDVLETASSRALKRDTRGDNEFYTGVSGQMGEFSFERAPTPQVKIRDVVGRSFDGMKTHLTDLATYSRFIHLYTATAPRGKIKSNMIAIGPYGCGKTEIARAIAADPRFIGAEVSVTDALTAYFGEFEKNVDRVWEAAATLRRDSGDNKLVFMLMDEFDAWFNKSNGHWVDQTYTRVQKALQMKLDGVTDYPGIVTVGFTNEPARIPLALLRRFKYVDIVGELEPDERVQLLKQFLTRGLPLSTGFRAQHYEAWGQRLEGATGDIIGKVVDDIHYDFMREFIGEHPREGRRLNNYIARQMRDGEPVDIRYVKRTMGQHGRVTPATVGNAIDTKLGEPIIREQIDTAVRVYAEARQVLANLHKRDDAASGAVGNPMQEPVFVPRPKTELN
jgi:SpoVK/Ycf46/Vps4 family AAA+-type ATPase